MGTLRCIGVYPGKRTENTCRDDFFNYPKLLTVSTFYNLKTGIWDKEAAIWFTRAAEQGDAAAQYNLGLMYARGEGVPQDYVTALMWLNIAVANGYKDDADRRSMVVKLLTPEQIAEAQRLAKEWMEKHRKD